MKKHFRILLILVCISSAVFAQEGKSFGIQGGVGTGGLSGITGYNATEILTTGGIFKQWMKTQKKHREPSYGLEMQLDVSFVGMNNDNGSHVNVTTFTLPLLFKINIGSIHSYQESKEKDDNGKTKYETVFKAIYLFAGPVAGYLSTNAPGPGTLSPVYGGGMVGLQIWVNNFKLEVSGNRSLTTLYKGNNNYVFWGSLSIGVAF